MEACSVQKPRPECVPLFYPTVADEKGKPGHFGMMYERNNRLPNVSSVYFVYFVCLEIRKLLKAQGSM